MNDSNPRPPLRRCPCVRCRFDLRGHRVGDRCPECGWTIDGPVPLWCNARDLERLGRAGLIGCIACIILLIVPLAFVAAVLGSSSVGLEAVLVVFYILMPVQVIAQFVAISLIGSCAIGERRRLLVAMSIVRLVAFATGLCAPFYGDQFEAAGLRALLPALYFALPLLAAGSDFLTARSLASLTREAGVTDSPLQTLLDRIARGTLAVVWLPLYIPVLGWFFAPILWTVSMARVFNSMGRLSRRARLI